MNKYGLIGRNISYSFSKKYFKDKFQNEGIKNSKYEIYDIDNISEVFNIIRKEKILKGLNVTIPYKEEVMKILDDISEDAKEIKSVNTIKIIEDKLIGFNTDAFGFEKSIKLYKKDYNQNALILGTGGSSKAIRYVLEKIGVGFLFVSRTPKGNKQISYNDINKKIIDKFNIIINCTPIGTYPNIDTCPDIPYECLSEKNLIYDLTYNPPKTLFMKRSEKRGATAINGLKMLHYQADKSWEIWNDKL